MNSISFTELGDKGNWIGGALLLPSKVEKLEVTTPYWGRAIATIPLSGRAELDGAVEAATAAWPEWRDTPVGDRTQIMFRFKALMERDYDQIAHLVALENGKTVPEAKGSIDRGIDVVEFATSFTNVLRGNVMNVSNGVSCEALYEPLGVVAGITPFNFPIMVPLWMIPIAITSGNCFILKPSEQTPLSALKIAELLTEAGLPDGVFSVVNGTRNSVEAITDHPNISAVAFVGSSKVAEIVYSQSTANTKRALCLGGAKNHLIVVPDAEEKMTVDGVISSSMGSAGQRCMAASVMVGVEEVQALIHSIVKASAQLKLGEDMGAVISATARERIIGMIDKAEEQGASIILDGRNPQVPNHYEGGYWLGPTIIDHASPEMTCAQEEIFGPVLTIVRTESLQEAMKIENGSPYGNAASVFTTSGAVSRYVSEHASAGMVGINIGVPVPRDPFSFGGWNQSKFGHGDITGTSGLSFWTNLRKVTTRWPAN
ncbi:MAG: methylmalonate-semialdehyde dehydrogenase (CoA acylating) [Candidatus Marinimicrobia bacterium]|nr:methylmalonate-semialdehyde dehydrogenase (CoA acylating) [Candidatus Neomarinimicrobiota bacterium]|tara:strand:+ start:1688 stop:3145 length:1458 start_codon:yes stop_codon:yes gene_type:complete